MKALQSNPLLLAPGRGGLYSSFAFDLLAVAVHDLRIEGPTEPSTGLDVRQQPRQAIGLVGRGLLFGQLVGLVDPDALVP